MATTATISVSSDIAPGFGGISETMTLTQAATLIDIDSTTGFSIRKLSGTGAVDLIEMALEIVEPKDSVAAKIFIRNIGYKGVTDKSVGVTVGVKAEPIGKLYGGDWMMIPVTGIDASSDVVVTPETNDAVVLEYALYYQEYVA